MSSAGETPDASAARGDVEESRETLGDQARAKVEEGKEQLQELQETAKAKARRTADQAKEQPAPAGGIVAAVAGALGIAWLLRRRRRRRKQDS
jgi:MYXO-CTERM domain-containing protein